MNHSDWEAITWVSQVRKRMERCSVVVWEDAEEE